MTASQQEAKRQRDQLGWGLFMIGIGVVILLVQQDLLPELLARAWWPYVIVLAGLIGLATARDPKAIGSGVTTMGIGVWLLATVNHWYGLRWSNSWPLALVAAGLGTLVEWAAAVVAE